MLSESIRPLDRGHDAHRLAVLSRSIKSQKEVTVLTAMPRNKLIEGGLNCAGGNR
jgi:hypothetical protein